MRPLFSAVVVALMVVGCGRSREASSPTMVIFPESYTRAPTAQAAAPVTRGTIRLGESDHTTAPEETQEAAPTAVGGGPQSGAQTSVGPMSPTTVTGADSPLDSATTAGAHAGQPANPTMTGSASAPAGPNSHGGVVGHPAGR
jgi:hypothetical protein